MFYFSFFLYFPLLFLIISFSFSFPKFLSFSFSYSLLHRSCDLCVNILPFFFLLIVPFLFLHSLISFLKVNLILVIIKSQVSSIRSKFSHLNEHKFRHSFSYTVTPMCACGGGNEAAEHFCCSAIVFLLRDLSSLMTFNI